MHYTHINLRPNMQFLSTSSNAYQSSSKQNMLDPYGPQMGFYTGPVWAAHMEVMWVLQQGSMLDPHGYSIWVQYGPH